MLSTMAIVKDENNNNHNGGHHVNQSSTKQKEERKSSWLKIRTEIKYLHLWEEYYLRFVKKEKIETEENHFNTVLLQKIEDQQKKIEELNILLAKLPSSDKKIPEPNL
jgi:hypothetical protein